MSKEQYVTSVQSESHMNTSEELGNSLPARTGPYRSLSAKRPRDPSHRKSVSFNDVPIVHEVPLYDTMRNANCDTYRSWAHTDATPPTSVIPSFYTSQILVPFNSTNAAAQKVHANRLSSTLYSTSSTTATTNRIPDWAMRTKSTKSATNSEETNTAADVNTNTNSNSNSYSYSNSNSNTNTSTNMNTNTNINTNVSTSTNTNITSNHATGNSSVIVVHVPDERTIKDITVKQNNHSTQNNLYLNHSQVLVSPASVLSYHSESVEDKKHVYRTAMIPDTEHYRNVPFTYQPVSDSTATYTSMLSTNIIQSNHSSNEPPVPGYTRPTRARSATLPTATSHTPIRTNDTVSITPFRATTATLLPSGSTASTRAVLRPTTIAFQCSQPPATSVNIINGPSTMSSLSSVNNTSNTNQPLTATNMAKPPPVPARFNSAVATAPHSRFILPQNRTYPSPSLTSSGIKYTFAHPAMDSALMNTMTTQNSVPKPPPTPYARSRSAHVLSTRRAAASPVVMIDGQSNGGTTANVSNNLYATAKRNPNVRQTYGSYYMHRVLLPTTIH